MKKRKLEVVVISDVHLGTLACHAEELLTYLYSIAPKKLVLNGNIVDLRQSKTPYFPSTHMKILRKIMGMASKGTEVYYITGDHDERLRKLHKTSMGNLHVVDELVLELDGKKTWFVHGDIFNFPEKYITILFKLGDFGYQLLRSLHRLGKWITKKMRYQPNSLSSKNLQAIIKRTTNFERSATKITVEKDYEFVVCGQTHQPKKENFHTKHGKCTYLNSGDWVENLTALEYSLKRWKLYRFKQDKLSPFYLDEDLKEMDIHELVATITEKREQEIQQDEESKKKADYLNRKNNKKGGKAPLNEGLL